jgi:two-component sensor histidine kinase
LDFEAYVDSLTLHLKTSMGLHRRDIHVISTVERIDLELDRAIPCGLMINELVSNAMKYAFTDDIKDQKIQIQASAVEGNYVLEVCDNGIGLPAGTDPKKSTTLGRQLAETLVEQLDGSLQIDRTNGTEFTIQFPIAMP